MTGKLAVLGVVLGVVACGSRSPYGGPADASAPDGAMAVLDAVTGGDAPMPIDVPAAGDVPVVPSDAPVAPTDAPVAPTDAPVAACTAGDARCGASGRRQRCSAAGAWAEEDYVCTVSLSGSSDYNVMCGLKADGRLGCWASDDWSSMQAAKMVADTPAGRAWKQISVGDGAYKLCAVDTAGKAACWGADRQPIPAPAGTYASLSFTDYGSCGLRDDGTGTCFGGVALPADFAGRFTSLVTANQQVYGIDEAGTLHAPSFVLSAYPAGKYVQLTANNGASCAIRDDGSLFCFPVPAAQSVLPPPSGADFTQVATTYGNNQGCAIRRDGTLACWVGNGGQPPLAATPPGRYVHIAGTMSAICGIRTDGTTVCWGRSDLATPTAPAGW